MARTRVGVGGATVRFSVEYAEYSQIYKELREELTQEAEHARLSRQRVRLLESQIKTLCGDVEREQDNNKRLLQRISRHNRDYPTCKVAEWEPE